jgi:hypothetical protein
MRPMTMPLSSNPRKLWGSRAPWRTSHPNAPDRAGVTGRIKSSWVRNPKVDSRTSRYRTWCSSAAEAWRLETVDGAELEDVTVTNITMRGIVSSPILLRLGSIHHQRHSGA